MHLVLACYIEVAYDVDRCVRCDKCYSVNLFNLKLTVLNFYNVFFPVFSMRVDQDTLPTPWDESGSPSILNTFSAFPAVIWSITVPFSILPDPYVLFQYQSFYSPQNQS